MNLQHEHAQTPAHRQRRDEANTRLNGRWLVLVKLIWVVLVVFILLFFFSSFVTFATYQQEICTNSDTSWIAACRLGQVFTAGAQIFGLALENYGVFTVALTLIWTFVWFLVAVVIFWQRSDNWMALLVALILIVEGSAATEIASGLTQVSWAGQAFVPLFQFLDGTSIILLAFLFPTGRFVPRWTLWLAIALIVLLGFQAFLPDSPVNVNNWPSLLNTLAILGIFGALSFSQVYRYRRVSSVRQRQQTRWVVFAFGIVLVGIGAALLGLELLPQYFPMLRLPPALYDVLDALAWQFSPVLIPIAFGIAILRSRLYDIDVLINRTLVYGTLTLTLVLIYVGCVIGLQSLLRGIFNQNSDVAIVGSTLVVAALFQSIRRRIQQIIDRRFYRPKYDAAKTLAAFSATLRNEVDLNTLHEQLLDVVQETMQPLHVSLWLRRPPRTENHSFSPGNPPSVEGGVREEIVGNGM